MRVPSYNYIIAPSDPGGYDAHYTKLSSLVAAEQAGWGSGDVVTIDVSGDNAAETAAVSIGKAGVTLTLKAKAGEEYDPASASAAELNFTVSWTNSAFASTAAISVSGIRFDFNKDSWNAGGAAIIHAGSAVDGCHFYRSREYGATAGLMIQGGVTVRKCRSSHITGAGFRSQWVTSGNAFFLACLADNCSTGFIGQSGYVATLKNNLAYNNTTNYSGTAFHTNSTNNAASDGATNTPPGASPYTSDVVSGDFVDAAGGDFHLSPTSGLIGQGANLYSDFTTDIDGDTWPSSGAWDIGFDYFTGGAGASVTVPSKAYALTTSAPGVSTGVAVAVPAKQFSLFATAPAVATGVSVAVPAKAYGLTLSPPTIDAGLSTVISAPAKAYSLVATAPSLSTGVSVGVPAKGFSLSLVAPTIATGVRLSIPAKAFSLVLTAPAVSQPDTIVLTAKPEYSLAIAPYRGTLQGR